MAFFTKKQKRLMRERKKKKKLADEGEVKNSSPAGKKRPRTLDPVPQQTVEELVALTALKQNYVVVVPKSLSAKDQKKFRKDARRQARAEGRDESKLQFVLQGSKDPEPKKKKPRKEFPSINELVKQEKAEKQEEKEKQALKDADAKLPQEYKSKYVAMDCEMVGIGTDGKQSALARVSITDWDGNVVIDRFVKVPTRVTDFRTWVSGVKPKHLKDDAMEVAECREKVAEILKGKVLVGHALKNDFSALMLSHPKEDIRDTAKYRRFQRFGGNKWRPRKLRDLVKENLDMTIQEEGQSHDSVDDANAAMGLFKLARGEWESELHEKQKKGRK